MRVAITSRESSLESQVDQRFGRARYFMVVDTETSATEFHDNEVNLNAVQGAGIQSAQNVSQLGIGAVITGHVGPNAFRTLSAAGIAVYTGATGSVSDALDMLKSGAIAPVEAADVEGHWII
jgi:predicted Fe-Mo cluster-binding NifX family protein